MGGLITSSRHERPAPAVAARTSRTRRARSVPFETLNGTQAIRKPRSNNSAPSSLQVTYYWARAIHLSIQSNPPPHSRSTRSTQQHATGRSQQLATQISASHLAPPFHPAHLLLCSRVLVVILWGCPVCVQIIPALLLLPSWFLARRRPKITPFGRFQVRVVFEIAAYWHGAVVYGVFEQIVYRRACVIWAVAALLPSTVDSDTVTVSSGLSVSPSLVVLCLHIYLSSVIYRRQCWCLLVCIIPRSEASTVIQFLMCTGRRFLNIWNKYHTQISNSLLKTS